MKFFRSDIGYRFLTRISGYHLLVAVLITILQVGWEYQHTYEKLHTNIQEVIELFKPSLSHALWHYQPDQLQSIAQGLQSNPYILGVSLISDDQSIKIDLGTQAVLDSKDAVWPNYESQALQAYQFPLSYEDNRGVIHQVGLLSITSNPTVISNALSHELSLIVITAILRSLFLCTLSLLLIKKLVARPVEELNQMVQHIQTHGLQSLPQASTPQQLSWNSDDELGTLSKNFEDMCHHLNQQYTLKEINPRPEATSTSILPTPAQTSDQIRTQLQGIESKLEDLAQGISAQPPPPPQEPAVPQQPLLLPTQGPPHEPLSRAFVKKSPLLGNMLLQNELSDVCYIELEKPYCRIFFGSGNIQEIRVSLDYMHRYFEGELFRISKTHLVHLNKIKSIHYSGSKSRMTAHLTMEVAAQLQELPVSRQCSTLLYEKMPQLFKKVA